MLQAYATADTSLPLSAGDRPLTMLCCAILGHRHVDTTLRYARTRDSTAAKEYQRAVAHENSLLARVLPGGYHYEAGKVNLSVRQHKANTMSWD